MNYDGQLPPIGPSRAHHRRGFRVLRRLVGLVLAVLVFLAFFLHFFIAVAHAPADSLYGLPALGVAVAVLFPLLLSADSGGRGRAGE